MSCTSAEPEPTLDLPPIEWSGRYLAFGTDVEDTICPQTLLRMDEFTGAALDHLRAETDLPISYYYLEDALPTYGFGCGDEDWGCAFSRDGQVTVGARHIELRHEIIHATSAHLPHRVLEEGLAEYFGANLGWRGVAEPTDIHAAFDSVEGDAGSLDPTFYPVAGHFVGHLIERYGREKVVALAASSAPGQSLDELNGVAMEILGADLGREIDDYVETEVGCEVAQYSPSWFECDVAPSSIPILSCDPSGVPTTIEVDVTCGGGASGVRDGKVWRDILIDVSAPVDPLLHVEAGGPVEFVVHGCGAGCGTTFERLASTSIEPETIFQAFHLEPGLSLIRVVKPIESAGTVRFGLGMSCG